METKTEQWTWNYKGCSFPGESLWTTLKSKTNDEIRSALKAANFKKEVCGDVEIYTKVKKANLHYSKNRDSKVQLFDMPLQLTLRMDTKSGEVTQTKQLVSNDGWCAGIRIDQLGVENVLVYCVGSNLLMTEMMTWSGNLAIHLSETLDEALNDESDIEEAVFSKGFRYIGTDIDNDGEDMVRSYEIRILNLGGQPLQFSIPEHIFHIVSKPVDNLCSVEDCTCCTSEDVAGDEIVGEFDLLTQQFGMTVEEANDFMTQSKLKKLNDLRSQVMQENPCGLIGESCGEISDELYFKRKLFAALCMPDINLDLGSYDAKEVDGSR